METTMIVLFIAFVLASVGLYFSWKQEGKVFMHREKKMMKRIRHFQTQGNIETIKSSGKTHVANYTKYRYNGASKRDVEVWHSPTDIWVPYYLMFNTSFEDSCIRYNGEDVTSYDNTYTTQQEASESTFSRSQYDGSRDDISCDIVSSRNYYDCGYSSSSSSDSSSDSGSSSSSSSSSYD